MWTTALDTGLTPEKPHAMFTNRVSQLLHFETTVDYILEKELVAKALARL